MHPVGARCSVVPSRLNVKPLVRSQRRPNVRGGHEDSDSSEHRCHRFAGLADDSTLQCALCPHIVMDEGEGEAEPEPEGVRDELREAVCIHSAKDHLQGDDLAKHNDIVQEMTAQTRGGRREVAIISNAEAEPIGDRLTFTTQDTNDTLCSSVRGMFFENLLFSRLPFTFCGERRTSGDIAVVPRSALTFSEVRASENALPK